MIDAHVHIERGQYSIEWIDEFVRHAQKNNIDELYLLEHSHRFIDFKDLYSGVTSYNKYQNTWLKQKNKVYFQDYVELIQTCKNKSYPINIYFGLEICYFPDKKDYIRNICANKQLDFLTGSIHWIDNWGFDHKKEFWLNKNIDSLYIKYYDLMIDLVKSNLFTHLAHPDSIKCFDMYPNVDLRDKYVELAKSIFKNKIKVEVSGGLNLNYGHSEIGINKKLLNILKEYNVDLIPASDAHSPEHVGMNIMACYEQINCARCS